MTYKESIQETCRKLNIDYNDVAAGLNELFKLDDLKSWINLAAQRAWDFHKWIFSEEAVYSQTSSEEYYDYPDNFVSDSIFLLKVEQADGKMETYGKKRYEDYMKYREDYSDGEDKIFSDYRRYYFINPNTFSGAGRKIEIWGKKKAIKLLDDADLLPFSPDTDDEENSGNEAIVKIAYAIALASDKKKDPSKAAREEADAYTMLKIIADKEKEEQIRYQVKNRPLFDIPQFF